MRTRKRDAKQTKRQILAAAERIFVEKGYDAARVDAIAAEAEVNKRMIYVYFGNKEQLYTQVLEKNFENLFALDAPALEKSLPPVQGAKRLVRAHFWFLAKNPNYVRLLGWEILGGGARAGRVLLETAAAGLEELSEVIRRGIDQGVFRKDLDPRRCVMSLVVLSFGYFSRMELLGVLWEQDLRQRDNLESLLEHIVDFCFNGICVAPSLADEGGAPRSC